MPLQGSSSPSGYGSTDHKSSAQEAHSAKDTETIIRTHSIDQDDEDEDDVEYGDYVKALQFGGLDGILTSFSIVASAAGSGLSWQRAITISLSTVLAAALSMGVGEFLSEKAETEHILQEKGREAWEVEKNKDGEIAEMVHIFHEEKGMSLEDAEFVIKEMAKYEEFFIRTMMSQELKMMIPDEKTWLWDAVKCGLVMFVCFFFFGTIPVLGYIILPAASPTIAAQNHSATLFIIACVATGVTLFFLGGIGARFTKSSIWMKGSETVLLGSVCAAIAFSVSKLVSVTYSSTAAQAVTNAQG